jgi:hypothetical protein
MTDFNALIDSGRIEAAHAGHAKRLSDEADATAAAEKAAADAKAAHVAAQRAADGGASLDKLMPLEEAVEAANRKLAVARRMAGGASTRRQVGEVTLANEVKQAHGAAMQAGMQRFFGIREEALAAFARLEELKREHVAVRGNLMQMANVAKSGIPGLVDVCRQLINDDGTLMDSAEFNNRLNENHHHEWDAANSKLRWVE